MTPWQQGSADCAAAEPGASTAGASAGCAQPAPEGSGRRLGQGAHALRPGEKASERQPGVGLAMGVPPADPLARQGIRNPGPHRPPFVRDTPAGARPGHPHHPGATRPQGCEHHHDLHACAQPRAARGTKPGRHSVTHRTVGSDP
jgi:hypothetical protein